MNILSFLLLLGFAAFFLLMAWRVIEIAYHAIAAIALSVAYVAICLWEAAIWMISRGIKAVRWFVGLF